MNKIIILIIATFLTPIIGVCQDTSLGFPNGQNDTVPQVANKLNFASKPGKIIVHEDERLKSIEEFTRSGEGSVEGVKIDGFRVLIFFDQNKTLAEQQKAQFISLYPQHKAYVDYMAPNYRVRVGNFRTELEAEKLKQEILGIYPTSIVVADKIQLPNLSTEN